VGFAKFIVLTLKVFNELAGLFKIVVEDVDSETPVVFPNIVLAVSRFGDDIKYYPPNIKASPNALEDCVGPESVVVTPLETSVILEPDVLTVVPPSISTFVTYD